MTTPHKAIGEITEATTKEFTAQSYTLNSAPELGSVVKTPVGEHTLFGVVYEIMTGSLDPSRKAMALGNPDSNLGEIISLQPQLGKLLRTFVKARVVGFDEEHFLPTFPPRLHEGIYPLTGQELDTFTSVSLEKTHYLKDLLELSDELVAAHIRFLCQDGDQHKLVRAAKAVTQYLKNDHIRLTEILKRIQ